MKRTVFWLIAIIAVCFAVLFCFAKLGIIDWLNTTYNQTHEDPIEVAYSDGYNDGYRDGYEDGLQEGKRDAE